MENKNGKSGWDLFGKFKNGWWRDWCAIGGEGGDIDDTDKEEENPVEVDEGDGDSQVEHEEEEDEDDEDGDEWLSVFKFGWVCPLKAATAAIAAAAATE